MTQLVLVKRRDDGDCEFITAIQNDADSVDIPALEWILQITKSEILGIKGEIQEQLAHFVKTIPFTDFGVASLHFHK